MEKNEIVRFNKKQCMGNNPTVGATVTVAVSVWETAKAGKKNICFIYEKFLHKKG